VSELLDDYAREPKGEGDAIFERFNAPKAAIIANYLAVMDVRTLRGDLHGVQT
jgi:hypothetical protein